MSIMYIILIFFILLVVLPVSAYMIMKFGALGLFRAKREDKQKTDRQIDNRYE